ncbi:beta-1,3-endoglucanase [Moelleriella libera RCEF 2490]|uniref:Beta-1,3-endoglucanase n=1 Tax=Moelleriella libera RCEF 2490 TaxID=1081109 RepID=A0A166VB09_9HYPO|nr:beta-1,3-endoglucanase [Moelleriella libera RCEF 2490]
MAPSLRSMGVAALACAGNAAAVKWQLTDNYNSTNFFDKFHFFDESDPTRGYTRYRNLADAKALGLAKIDGDEIVLRPDSTTMHDKNDNSGRSSIRLESKATFEKQLVIGTFNYLPQDACGAWPAFWSFHEPWLTAGEIDIMEGWNMMGANKPAIHTGGYQTTNRSHEKPADYKTCFADQSLMKTKLNFADCDNDSTDLRSEPKHWQYEGCHANDPESPWNTNDGGIYAVEWTDDFIKLYSFRHGNAPANIHTDSPDTSTWGGAILALSRKGGCDLDKHFAPQRLILNIAFCGATAGQPDLWRSVCAKTTGEDTCNDFVRRNPSAFNDVYYKVKNIRFFNEAPQTTSTSTSSMPASTSTISTSVSITSSASVSSSSSVSVSSSSSIVSVHTTNTTRSHPTTPSAKTVSASSASVHRWSNTSTKAVPSTKYSSVPVVISSSSGSQVVDPSGSGSAASVPVATSSSSGSQAVGPSGPGSAASVPAVTPAASMTTVTVYTETLSTITSCAPGVPGCTTGRVVTVVVPAYTTVCPVDQASRFGPRPTQNAAVPAADPGNRFVNDEKTVVTKKITETFTITSCGPAVTDCQIGKVTTRVTEATHVPQDQHKPAPRPTHAPAPAGVPGAPGVNDRTTITTKITKTHTITDCGPAVTDCAVGKVVTEVVTTTYCPGDNGAVPSGNGNHGGVPAGNGNGNGNHGGVPAGGNGNNGKVPAGGNGNNGNVPAGDNKPKGGFATQSPFRPAKTQTVTKTATLVPKPKPTGSSDVCTGVACDTGLPKTNGTSPGSVPGNGGASPAGQPSSNNNNNGAPVPAPAPASGGSCVGPSCPPTCVGTDCPRVVTGGAAKQSLSVFALVGALAAVML